MLFQSTVVVALLASFVAAQSNSTIDPTSVPLTTRSQWCQGQQNTCGTLCSGSVGNNTCTPATLAYSCTCSANNSAPGLQYYKITMDTFICEQVFANCITASVGDSASQAKCRANEAANCGHLDPANFTAAAVTTTSAASTTAASTSGATAATGASSSSSRAAAATLIANAKYFGTGALAVGFGAMGLLI